MFIKSFKEHKKKLYYENRVIHYMGTVYSIIYDEERDLLVMQDNRGFLLPKHHIKEIIGDLKRYVDEFPQETIDEVNAYAEENNKPF